MTQQVQLQQDIQAQQQAQPVASRFTYLSHSTTASPVMSSPPMDMMSSTHQPLTGINLMPPPSCCSHYIHPSPSNSSSRGGIPCVSYAHPFRR